MYNSLLLYLLTDRGRDENDKSFSRSQDRSSGFGDRGGEGGGRGGRGRGRGGSRGGRLVCSNDIDSVFFMVHSWTLFKSNFSCIWRSLTLWCPRAIAVDSPPSSAPASGDQSRHNNS